MKNERMKKLSILLISMMAMMTSCVQGDLYELYEDDSFQIVRQKKSKDYLAYFSDVETFMDGSFVDGECAATLVHLMSDCSNRSARAAVIASSTSNETFPNVSHDAILSYLSSINLYSAPGGGEGIDYDNIPGALGILGISYSIPQSSQEVLYALL